MPLTKILVALVILFVFLLGVNYQSREELDYSKLEALEVEDGATKVSFKFLGGFLMNSRMACCFGVMPRENEFIYVEMPEGVTTKFMTDMPINVSGRLEIGEENLVGSLYTMDALSIKKADNF